MVAALLVAAVAGLGMRISKRIRGTAWTLIPWMAGMTPLVLFACATQGCHELRWIASARPISGDMGIGSAGFGIATFVQQIALVITCIFILLFPIEVFFKKSRSEYGRGANGHQRSTQD